MPPVPVAPIGTPVIPVSVRSPVISWSIVSWAIIITWIKAWTIIDRSGNTHGNMNSCLRFADPKKNPHENRCENKEKLSHSCD
jgi:hypothetical protein